MRELWEQAEAQQQAGRFAEAAELYQRILAQQPDQVPVLNNLGGVFEQLQRPAEALACYRRAVALAADLAVPQFNLGDALRKAGQWAEAIVVLRAAATLDPYLAEAWTALGAALLASGRPQAALGPPAAGRGIASPRTLDRTANWATPCNRSTNSRTRFPATSKPSANTRAVWRLGTDWGMPSWNAGGMPSRWQPCANVWPWTPHAPWPCTTWGKALFHSGCVEQAMPLLRRAAEIGSEQVQNQAWENLALIVPGSPADDNGTVLETRRAWGRRAARRIAATPPLVRQRAPGPLRIGYVSSFFHRPNWMKPVWGLINHHDRERFRLYLFSDAPAEQIRSGYRPQPSDGFCDISPLSNAAAAAAIAEQQLDILVDLNGYSVPRRLPLYALRPAPIVVGWFNLYATSGLDCFDYLVGDPQVIPEREEPFYTERILRVTPTAIWPSRSTTRCRRWHRRRS